MHTLSPHQAVGSSNVDPEASSSPPLDSILWMITRSQCIFLAWVTLHLRIQPRTQYSPSDA